MIVGFTWREALAILDKNRIKNLKRLGKERREERRKLRKAINEARHKVTLIDDTGKNECNGHLRKPDKLDKAERQIANGFMLARLWGGVDGDKK